MQIVNCAIKLNRIHVAYLYCPDIGIIRIGLKCVISLPMLSTLLGGPVVFVGGDVIETRFVSGSGGLLDRYILLFIDSKPKLIKLQKHFRLMYIQTTEILKQITCYHFSMTLVQTCSLRIAMVLY